MREVRSVERVVAPAPAHEREERVELLRMDRVLALVRVARDVQVLLLLERRSEGRDRRRAAGTREHSSRRDLLHDFCSLVEWIHYIITYYILFHNAITILCIAILDYYIRDYSSVL